MDLQIFPGQISKKLSEDKSVEATAAVWDVLHRYQDLIPSRYAKHFVGHTRHDMIQTFAKKLLMHETAERVLAPGTLTLRYAQKLFLYLHYCQLGVGVFSTGTQSQLDFINEIMCFKKIDPFTGLTLTCTYLKYEFSEYFF